MVLRASPTGVPPEAEARHLHTSPTTMNCYVACHPALSESTVAGSTAGSSWALKPGCCWGGVVVGACVRVGILHEHAVLLAVAIGVYDRTPYCGGDCCCQHAAYVLPVSWIRQWDEPVATHGMEQLVYGPALQCFRERPMHGAHGGHCCGRISITRNGRTWVQLCDVRRLLECQDTNCDW